MDFHTRCVALPPADFEPAAPTATPLCQTATFRRPSAAEAGPYDYARSGNPTRDVLETQLARLEDGTRGFAFASGLAALTAITHLLEAGDRVVAGTDLYGGTHRLLHQVLAGRGIELVLVDATDPDGLAAAVRGARLALIETPSNPFLRIVDLPAAAAACRAAGTWLAVDNTMLSPRQQQPLRHGADLVVHSATKHLGGHGDLTAGAIVTRDPGLAERLDFVQNATGTALGPFDAWLLLRSLRTLALRVDRASASAARLARTLAADPRVRVVHHPSLPGHPRAAIHRRQATGDGCVVSLETGDVAASERLVDALKRFALTVSFGCVHSSASLPCRMSHASIPAGDRAALGLPEDLVRLSVGIEDPSDLERDLRRAMATALPPAAAPRLSPSRSADPATPGPCPPRGSGAPAGSRTPAPRPSPA